VAAFGVPRAGLEPGREAGDDPLLDAAGSSAQIDWAPRTAGAKQCFGAAPVRLEEAVDAIARRRDCSTRVRSPSAAATWSIAGKHGRSSASRSRR